MSPLAALGRTDRAITKYPPEGRQSAVVAMLDEMARGQMVAEAVTVIGTQGTVFGEIDR